MSSHEIPVIRLARSKEDIPKDAVLLSEKEAKKFQWELISSWKPRSDVWPFTFGIGILGGAAAASGFYLNKFYRRKLKLMSAGLLSSTLPVVIFPAITAVVLHENMIASSILIGKTPCASCVEIRSILIQTLSGVLYPAILGPVTSFLLANRYLTYQLHPIQEPKKLFNQYLEITRPIFKNLRVNLILQGVLAAIITHLEFKSFVDLNKKLIQEDELLSN